MLTKTQLRHRQGQSRYNPTPTEVKAKELIESLYPPNAVKFQVIVGFYIVDFIVPCQMLAIEIDGKEHRKAFRVQKDASRTRFLEQCGFTVVRFKNKVIERGDKVTIAMKLSEFPDVPEAEIRLASALAMANGIRSKVAARQSEQMG